MNEYIANILIGLGASLFCIGILIILISSSPNQVEKRKNEQDQKYDRFIECYEKTGDSDWCKKDN